MLGGSNEPHNATHVRRPHFSKGVGKEWMPVAHSDEDRQWTSGRREARREAIGLPPRDLGDRRHAAKQLVVMRHLLDPLRGNAAPTKHVGQEWADVVRALRPAEGDDQNGVEQIATIPDACISRSTSRYSGLKTT